MDAVMSFNSELAALYECKPPISKAKMTSVTKAAIKAIKCYKHVVQSVEKFIQKCKTEYKIPGLYVIDSIVRQSRHQFGSDKDVFAPRFGKNILVTFYYLFKCPPEDKSRVIRVLNLWQKNNVFEEEIIQPIFDLSDPNHHVYKEISNQIHQKAVKVKQPNVPQPSHTTPQQQQQQQQQQQNQTPQHQHTPQTPQTPQHPPSATSVATPSTIASTLPNQGSNTVVTGLDPNLIQQIQQILMKTEEGVVASSVAVLSNLSSQPSAFLQGQPPAVLGMQNQPNQVPIHQPPPTIMPPQVSTLIPDQKASLIPGLSSSGDYDERTLPFLDTSLPPPGYLQNFSHTQPSHIPHAMTMPNLSQKPPSPKEEGEHSGESDEDKENHQDDVIQIDDRSRSPSYNRSRRAGKRSRSRSRSRSRHHRSRSRGRRSRSRDRDRRYRDRDRGRSRRDSDKDQEREKEKERKKRGLPNIKSDHLSVCSTTLWVGHLSKLVHQEELSDTFGEYGDIVSINLIPPRGCAFICMNRRQDASRALLKLRNYKMLNKTITIAWAPGKGVKGKEFKDYWEVDAGCSYVPYSKLTSMDTADLDALEEGGMIDEDTVPSWLKGKLSERFEANQREAQAKPQPNLGAMAVLPPVSHPLGIVQTLGKDIVTPIIPFALPNVPPPRIQPGTLPPLGPPLMPPLGVPPPIGMPPLTSVPSILGQPLIPTVPPHISMAATPQHLGPLLPSPHVIADQTTSMAAQDSDSMDVEMEDVQKSESTTPNKLVDSGNKDDSDKQKPIRFQPEEGGPVAPDHDIHRGSSPDVSVQPPPFGPALAGIRFGIVPRGAPGFGPRGMGIGRFLGPPPPIVGGRPGIVSDGPRGFRPIAPAMDSSVGSRFVGVPPPSRFPIPDRRPRRTDDDKNDWPAQENEGRKYRPKNEPWNAEGNPIYDNDDGRRRLERNGRPEPEDGPNRYRDRSRMRENDDNQYRGYDRENRNRDRGRERDRDRSRDHTRDRYDREPHFGRDRYGDARRDQWGGRGRFEERRGWHNDRKPWNDERRPWNEDRWNPNCEEAESVQEDNNTGWMNSESYALHQKTLSAVDESDKPQEKNRLQNESGDKESSTDEKHLNASTEVSHKQRRERDSTRVSRWERHSDEIPQNTPQSQADVPEATDSLKPPAVEMASQPTSSCVPPEVDTPSAADATSSNLTGDRYDPFECESRQTCQEVVEISNEVSGNTQINNNDDCPTSHHEEVSHAPGNENQFDVIPTETQGSPVSAGNNHLHESIAEGDAPVFSGHVESFPQSEDIASVDKFVPESHADFQNDDFCAPHDNMNCASDQQEGESSGVDQICSDPSQETHYTDTSAHDFSLQNEALLCTKQSLETVPERNCIPVEGLTDDTTTANIETTSQTADVPSQENAGGEATEC